MGRRPRTTLGKVPSTPLATHSIFFFEKSPSPKLLGSRVHRLALHANYTQVLNLRSKKLETTSLSPKVQWVNCEVTVPGSVRVLNICKINSSEIST